MTEFVRDAWHGWQNLMESGRLPALLTAALLLLWMRKSRGRSKTLLGYTAVMTALCIVPFTAAVLMLYQTRFYDYVWIWTAVPMVAVTAYGGVVCLTELWESGVCRRNRKIAFTAALLGVILLCGGLGNENWKVERDAAQREAAAQVLSEVEAPEGRQICLWAPREVMEYARELRGDITLFYGRNMWDKALDAYSYDMYTQEQEECSLWMDWVGETGKIRMGDVRGVDCVETAVSMGVNRILLPAGLTKKGRRQIEKKLGVKAVRVGEYYLFATEG